MKKTSANAVKAMNMNPLVYYGGAKKQAGEIGIEVEVEGRGLPQQVAKFWKVVPDGSLRGESAEYVLASPIKRQAVAEALKLLKDTLDQNGAVVNDSYRTSVHVHVNHQEINFRQIVNELCLYMIFEDLLIEMCGKDRIGNLFCLRVKDAEYFIEAVRHSVTSGDYMNLANNELFKYGAVNVAALNRYGSLEYRAFRGTVEPALINEWVEVLLQLKDAALKFDNPQQIVHQFSQLGFQRFVEQVFYRGDTARAFLNKPNVEKRLYEGIRDVQEIAFCVPTWDKEVIQDVPDKKDMYGGEGRVNDWGEPNGNGIQWARPQALEPRFINNVAAPVLRGFRAGPRVRGIVVDDAAAHIDIEAVPMPDAPDFDQPEPDDDF